MKRDKKMESIFERREITDAQLAQEIYETERKKLTFKLVCAIISLFSTVSFLLMKKDFGPILDEIIAFCGIAGWIATIASNPLNVLKSIVKFAKIGWYIIPFYFIDLLGLAIGAVFALYILFAFPIAYCAIGLYQSYINMSDAKEYLKQ